MIGGQIESIIQKKQSKQSGLTKYLVKFKRYPSASWQLESYLRKTIPNMLDEFNKLNKTSVNIEKQSPASPKNPVTKNISRSKIIQKIKKDSVRISGISTKQIKKAKTSQPINENHTKTKTILVRKAVPNQPLRQTSKIQKDKIQKNKHLQLQNTNKVNEGHKEDHADQIACSQIDQPMSSLEQEGDDWNDNQDDELFKEDPNFKILQMCRGGLDYLYLIQDSTSTRVISHAEVLREHTHALLDFYEAHLQFLPQSSTTLNRTANRKKVKK